MSFLIKFGLDPISGFSSNAQKLLDQWEARKLLKFNAELLKVKQAGEYHNISTKFEIDPPSGFVGKCIETA